MARASRAWLQTPPPPDWHRKPARTAAPANVHPRIYDGTCYWCGLPFDPTTPRLRRTREHIIPRAHGGSNAAANIAYAHHECNSLRGCDTSWVPFHRHGRIGDRVPHDDRGRYDAPRKD